LGVSRQGEFKNTIKIFLQKVHVENLPQNFDKTIDVSFSSTFFVSSRFRVFFSDGSSKALQKFDQKSKTDFFSVFVLSCFGAFLGEGSSKTRLKQYQKNKSDPGPFLC
jgi:hypothetical protein